MQFGWLESTALRLQAIALRLEAIALRMEAIVGNTSLVALFSLVCALQEMPSRGERLSRVAKSLDA